MYMVSNELHRVAVLLAAYNGLEWIEEQVLSILNQEGVQVTIFISVDLSTDGTEEKVSELANKHTNVIMLPYGVRFGGAGPNFFRLLKDVDITDFDAVALADQDDIWFHDKLQRACALISSGKCDVYSSNVIAFWPDGKQAVINKSQPQKRFDHFFEAAGPGCTYVLNPFSAAAFKYFLIEKGDRLSEVALHDWLAYAFCRERGFIWFIDQKPSMLYRQHGNNQVGINSGLAAYRKRWQLIHQGWYRTQVLTVIELVAPAKVGLFSSRYFLLRNFNELRRRARDRWFTLVIITFGFY
ncbi:glycosyltransferase [Litchfieldella xinjiangensis]|uniref:glycosyltransferase n=1 Tax=Litchfieldella xinjiangensis TaxID=1166948 RepID=UPI0018CF33FD|nr:glycosyltransferase [Halomonas xinjiangensis]